MLRRALGTDQRNRLRRRRWSAGLGVVAATAIAGGVVGTSTATAKWQSMNTNLVQHVARMPRRRSLRVRRSPLQGHPPDPSVVNKAIPLGIVAGPGPDTPVRFESFPPPDPFVEPFPVVVNDTLTVPFAPTDIGSSTSGLFNNYGLYTYRFSGGDLPLGSALLYVFGYPDLRDFYIDVPASRSERFLVQDCRLLDERAAPSCAVFEHGLTPNGAPYIVFDVRDEGGGDDPSGVALLDVASTRNATVSPLYFAHGTTDPIRLTATGTGPPDMGITFDVVDAAGNKRTCSANAARIAPQPGTPRRQTLTGIPQTANHVFIQNDSPGLTSLMIMVNTKLYSVSDLADGQQISLDVASAMREGNDNTVMFIPTGRPEGSATILISDG